MDVTAKYLSTSSAFSCPCIRHILTYLFNFLSILGRYIFTKMCLLICPGDQKPKPIKTTCNWNHSSIKQAIDPAMYSPVRNLLPRQESIVLRKVSWHLLLKSWEKTESPGKYQSRVDKAAELTRAHLRVVAMHIGHWQSAFMASWNLDSGE